ncbi:HSP20-like chaperone [Coprinopsis marcescibilis]|uniref:HSP20-like chaperone n=1 Tax=Coprinopsis marcescibilis TaxID=230819 RepID=A0A5C3L4M3_COPMA|nr:HSP20-like chaperone [Coprinopsis marcescibilis]
MSIGRALFNEIRPLFRMLEDPLSRRGGLYSGFPGFPVPRGQDAFDNIITSPAVDITEEGDRYVVDADIPGIKKENVEVTLGDDGSTLTIRGKAADEGRSQPTQKAESASAGGGTDQKADSAATQVATRKDSTQISTERPVNFSRNMAFTRTIWLPEPVDTKNLSAKLDHGVLTVILKKAKENKRSLTIPVD